MAKKEKVPQGVWVIVVIIAIIVIANKDISFQFPNTSYPSQTTTTSFVTTTTMENCGLSINPLAGYPGDTFSATFAGLPLYVCELFMDYEGTGWTSMGVFTTDGAGYKMQTETPMISGIYEFYVHCGYCDSNHVEVEVYDLCRNDDGDNPFVADTVISPSGTLSDYCLDGQNLVEYNCVGDSGVGKTYNCDLLDAECVDGRCREYTFDGDGDGWSDSEEEFYGTDPDNPNDNPNVGFSGGNCADLCDYLNPGNSGFCGYYEPGEWPWDCVYEGITGWYPASDVADEHCSSSWGIPNCCCYGV